MSNLKIDSSVSRRIVLAFLDFLKSVEPTPGADLEGLEVVRDCLKDVFKLNSSSIDDQTQHGLLVEYFSSLDANKPQESSPSHAATLSDAPSTSSRRDTDAGLSHIPTPQDEDIAAESHTSGVSKDKLFGQFFAALDHIHFFRTTTNGADDRQQLDRATHCFHVAVKELGGSGCQAIDTSNLAETFKSLGNRAMQSKLYSDAIELYTYAIALCQSNSVYYCNRAAAFTQIHKYSEAICDCKKSIEIDSKYSKAYSRLGLVYYAQGNYRDAIDKGFMKALQLDPDNDSVKENIRVAEQKLRDPQRTEQHQDRMSGNHSNHEATNGQARGPSAPPPFLDMPFNPADLSSGLASMFMNMVGQHPQGNTNDDNGADRTDEGPGIRIGNVTMNMVGQHPQGNTNDGNGADRTDEEPGIRIGNVTMNIGGEDVTEDFMGTMRSVMGMFSGVLSHQNSQGDINRGPTPN